jgi:hypothetical protein
MAGLWRELIPLMFNTIKNLFYLMSFAIFKDKTYCIFKSMMCLYWIRKCAGATFVFWIEKSHI